MILDSADFRLSNRVHSGKYHLSQSGRSNSGNIPIFQMGVRVCLSFGYLALSLSIKSILSIASDIKMVWINAHLIVASRAIMQNVFSFWNWTTVENPRSAVAPDVSALMWSFSNHSVPNAVGLSNPNPTAFSFSNPAPKSFFKARINSLRDQIPYSIFWLHNNISLLCRALGRFSAAEVFEL